MSAEGPGSFRQAEPGALDLGGALLVAGVAHRAEDGVDRGPVLGAGVGDPGLGGLRREVEDRVHVAVGHRVGGPGVELGQLRQRRGVDVRRQRPQVVRGEAGADDEHALVAQRRQLSAEGEEPARVEGGQRELQHRDVGLRVHLHQRDVRPVVEAAGLVRLHLGGGVEQAADGPRQVRGGGRVVRHRGVLLRKAPEVVHQGRADRRGHRDRCLLPVGGDHQDRLGVGQLARPGVQLVRPDGVIGERRGAVAEEDGGHASGHVPSLAFSSTFNKSGGAGRHAAVPG
ncbi:hypothetical protein SDC9_100837 [bioreactor metagenome]|uniref:Uncharacterized protein n=1 Tax=bioreactor metagenome TaxID=1076179 RepID=A0A645AX02_9ZZZZ